MGRVDPRQLQSAGTVLLLLTFSACDAPTAPATAETSAPSLVATTDRILGFSVTKLPTLGGVLTGALGVNAAGTIVGFGDLPEPAPEFERHPVIWRSPSSIEILPITTTRGSAARINNRGDAVGIVFGSGSSPASVALWLAGGGLVDLGRFGGESATGRDINDWGILIGNRRMPANILEAFRWEESTGVDLLPTLGGDWTIAADINELGQVVGGSRDPSGQAHAVMWTSTGQLTTLPVSGGSFTNATAINDIGQIVGTVDNLNEDRGFLLEPGREPVDMGGLGGDFTRPVAINNLGHAVGASSTPEGEFHAFVWTLEGGMVELPPPPEGNFSVALDVNDAGVVVGYWGTLADPTSAFEPAVWSLEVTAAEPSESTTRIKAGIENLHAEGLLEQGSATALLSKLNAVNRHLEGGNEQAAALILNALERQILALVRDDAGANHALAAVLDLVRRTAAALESGPSGA